MPRLTLELSFDVSWGRYSQGDVLFVLSADVEGDEVKNLRAHGIAANRNGDEWELSESDLSKRQLWDARDALLDAALERSGA